MTSMPRPLGISSLFQPHIQALKEQYNPRRVDNYLQQVERVTERMLPGATFSPVGGGSPFGGAGFPGLGGPDMPPPGGFPELGGLDMPPPGGFPGLGGPDMPIAQPLAGPTGQPWSQLGSLGPLSMLRGIGSLGSITR